jgi:hypothetical protein
MSMGRDRWDTVDRIYHAALARPLEAPAPYLAEACAGDDELRCEVESLLTQGTSADGLLTQVLSLPPPGSSARSGGRCDQTTSRRLSDPRAPLARAALLLAFELGDAAGNSASARAWVSGSAAAYTMVDKIHHSTATSF